MNEYKLEELLHSLTVEQLKNIRQNLSLKNMSKLRKKELVVALAENIPATVASSVDYMDMDQYSAVVRMMTKNGAIPIDELEIADVFYLGSVGYAHPIVEDDQHVLVMPKEIMEQFYKLNPAELKIVVNNNQKITNILFGMIRHYGIIECTVAKEMIENYTGEKINDSWFNSYVAHLENYYGSFRMSDGYIVNELVEVEDEDELIQKQQARGDLDYYMIPHQVMYQINRTESFDRTVQLQELMQYIEKNYTISSDEIEAILEECMYMVQSEEPLSDIVSYFGQYIEFPDVKDVQAFVPILVNVINHTRLWVLKGHTPNELSGDKMDVTPVQASVEKVGRNEPCPCGKGKKYKKCCGK